MADLNARTRLLVGTTADWAAANLVLGDGELVLERAAGSVIKMKAGDGATQYGALPFVSAQPTIPPEYLNQSQNDARYLMLADVVTTKTPNKVPRLDASGMLALAMVPLPPAIATSVGAADAGKLVMTSSTGKLDQSLVPLPPAIDHTNGPVDQGKLVMTASSGKVDPSLITVTAGTYRGLVDATAAKPAGTYLAGDYFLNTGNGLAHASWGFPGGTSVTPGQQIIYNGTTWDTVAGAAYLPISGGTLTGPLRVRDGGVYGGGAADGRFDGLVVEGNAGTGLSILAPAGTLTGIAFGRPGLASQGALLYDHSLDQMSFFAGGSGNLAITTNYLYVIKPFFVSDGSPTNPMYSFYSAQGTGMFASAASTIAWSTQGVQRMCLLPGPNNALVIGGGAPSAAWSSSLDINGSSNAGLNLDINGTAIGQLAAIPTAFNMSAVGNLPIIFYSNGAERMRLAGQALTVSTVNGIVVNGASTPTLQLNDTTANGPSTKFVSNGGAKYIRCDAASGHFQVLNGAYSAILLDVSDTAITDSTGWELGWKDIPAQSVNVAVSASLRGSAIPINASPYTGLPASGMPPGSTICLVNVGAIAITINGWAGLHLAGSTATGNRVLAPWGFATVWYQTGTVAYMTGNVS